MWSKQSRFTVLVEAWSGDLYRYAYWLCRDESIAEDLVQETFARTWRSLDSLRDEGAAKSWLFTTLRRENARRYERRRADFVSVEIENIERQQQDLDTSTEAFVLRGALDRLSDTYREPLLLQILGGFSCDEIAELLGISKAAVMTRLFRARQKLRESLTGEEKTYSVENRRR